MNQTITTTCHDSPLHLFPPNSSKAVSLLGIERCWFVSDDVSVVLSIVLIEAKRCPSPFKISRAFGNIGLLIAEHDFYRKFHPVRPRPAIMINPAIGPHFVGQLTHAFNLAKSALHRPEWRVLCPNRIPGPRLGPGPAYYKMSVHSDKVSASTKICTDRSSMPLFAASNGYHILGNRDR